MDSDLFGLIEVTFFFGLILAFAVREWVVTRRSMKSDADRAKNGSNQSRP